LRIAEPMIPMRLFANKVFSIGNVALFASSSVMTALIIVVPLYYQTVLRWPADQAGLQLIALTGGMATGGFFIGSAVSWFGRAKIFPLVGGFLAAFLCLLIAHEGLGRSTSFDIACTALLGASIGCQINPVNVMVQNGLELRDIGTGVASSTFLRTLGGAFGVAGFSTFLIGRLAAGAALVPGHEKLGADLGIGLLRQDSSVVFDATQTAAFTAVREHAFAMVFIAAAIVFLIGVAAVAVIDERPLRTGSGRR
jgi:hypothetical protein